MADFSVTKTFGTATYPVHNLAASGLMKRCEPILTPDMLTSRFLKGVSLTFPNGDKFTSDDLKDQINLAINESEMLLGLTINKEEYKEKLPFERHLYQAFIHLVTERGPIISLEHLAIVSSDNQNIFELPTQWIETANFSKNQINVVPLLAAFGITTLGGAVGSGGLAFLAMLGGMQYLPGYWQVIYSTGLSTKEGQVPVPVNQLIGCVTAINLLSQLATMYKNTSISQSQDGISQSSSSNGVRIYTQRIEDLEKQKEQLIKKMKAIFHTKYVFGNL